MYKEKLKELLFEMETMYADLFAIDFVNFKGTSKEYNCSNEMFLTFNGMIDFLNDTLSFNWLKEKEGINIRIYRKAYGKKYAYVENYILTAPEINRLKEGEIK